MAIPTIPKPDKWPLRPFDPRCKTLVDYSQTVDDQIRCRVPAWSGTFQELKPELTAQGLRLADLSKLTVNDIGQYVIRAAQGGAMSVGPIGTTTHTITQLSLPRVTAAREYDFEWAAGNLTETHWLILKACVEKGFTDRGSAKSVKDITAHVMGATGKPSHRALTNLRNYFDTLKSRGFIDREKGVGSWATEKGVAVFEARQVDKSRIMRIVS